MFEKTRKILLHPIKKEILNYIEESDGAFYGDLVMNLNHTKYAVLKYLIELKKNGYVFKEDDGGKFKIE